MRFIQQQEARVTHQGDGEREASALAGRELAVHGVDQGSETQLVEHGLFTRIVHTGCSGREP